ncbi:MraY family glycosyltransferase [Streptomyces sp. NPDC058308]|uniref:MraY family glycosyltransferase n=1 Tax=Streptomyces sp. NPDC058308 TaxID=3346440 RepID=UPI0036E9AC1D
MRDFLLVLCVVTAVTCLATGPVRKFAIAAGAAPAVRARDVHRVPTPRLGGIAMFCGLCAGLLVAARLPGLAHVFPTGQPQALLAGAAVIWLVGVLDDKFEIDAFSKLGGQIIAAGVMVYKGLVILWLPIPGYGTLYLDQVQGSLLTVALIVITINAVNFVDGLDGLAAGMICIAAAAFLVHSYRLLFGYGIEAAEPAALFSAVLVGMCLGFLPHNVHPARIFMGDSGSMLIGTVLAGCAISLTGQVDASLFVQAAGSTHEANKVMVPLYIPLLLPLTVLALPVSDLVLAFVRRTWRGQSPFAADKGHLHHRLLQIGHSHRRAVLIMYAWAALFAFGTVAVAAGGGARWLLLGLLAVSATGMVVLMLPGFSPSATLRTVRSLAPRLRPARSLVPRLRAARAEEPSPTGAPVPVVAQQYEHHAPHGRPEA